MHILLGTETSIIKHVTLDVMTLQWDGSRPCLSPRLLKSRAEQSQPLFGHSPSSGVMVSLILKCKCILTHVESLFILKLKCRVGHDVLWKCLDMTNGESARPSLMYLDKRICPHSIRLVDSAAPELGH